MRTALALVATFVSGFALATPAPRLVDYLYIEANEGGSSGGHVAIRFGDETYHFQHESSGFLRLRRDDSRDFRYRYGVLGNRTTHVSRISVSDAAYARLRWEFAERFFRERVLFAHRDALRDDRQLLSVLLSRRRGHTGVALPLRGAGFFFPADERSPASPVVGNLRERIARTYGQAFLQTRADEVRRELAALVPTPYRDDTPPGDDYPRFAATFSARYRDLLTELVALNVLEDAPPLRPDARRGATQAEAMLDDAERKHLAALADRMTDALVRLVESSRPDRGFALLVGMARLETLRESVRSGRLVVLDAFPPDADLLRSAGVRHAEAIRGLLAEARSDLARIRTRLRESDDVGEETVSALESAGSRVSELQAALSGHDLRVSPGPLLPSREAAWSVLPVPDVAETDLAKALADSADAERRYDNALGRRYGYDLLTRNCVSELVATAEQAGVDLGGHLDGRWPLDVIPFVSARAVDDAWNVVARTTQPAYRRARLDDIYSRENRLLAWLRESNVVTSTIYRRNEDDSFFVFFTDDTVAPRPLLGAMNVVAGLGAGVLGIALAPFDGARTVAAGIRGVIFSLPELAFVNLRKGTFDYVPPDERPTDTPDVIAIGDSAGR